MIAKQLFWQSGVSDIFRGQSPQNVWLIYIFMASKHLTMILKNYIHDLRSYTNSGSVRLKTLVSLQR